MHLKALAVSRSVPVIRIGADLSLLIVVLINRAAKSGAAAIQTEIVPDVSRPEVARPELGSRAGRCEAEAPQSLLGLK
jgi:hypothetical protein